MRRGICLFVFVLFVSVAESPLAGVINVPADQPTIQDGINAAVGGDTVLIADGTYTGAGNRDIDFGGKGIVVTSVNGADVTIIDCEHSYRGFIFDSGEGPGSVLRGLTVLHANADTGAALYINASSPVVDKCVLQQYDEYTHDLSLGSFGRGGACLHGSHATFTDCRFRFNSAQAGAGLYVSGGSDITVTDCIFEQNLTNVDDMLYSTGAIFIWESSPQIHGCLFDRNVTEVINFEIIGTPGIRAARSDVVVSHCVFVGNSADMSYGWGSSALALAGGSPIVEHCTFFDNDVLWGFHNGYTASCIYSQADELIVRNNIFAYNKTETEYEPPPVIHWYEDSTTTPVIVIECNVFFDNGHSEWSGPLAAYNNNFGNVYVAPRFCDTASGDFHPDTLSICAPASNSCGVLIGALPIDSTCSLGCCTGYKGNVDCDPLDIVDITDIQVMISKEFLLPGPPCCYGEADLDNSGVVDITDLSLLIDNQFLTLTPLPPCQ